MKSYNNGVYNCCKRRTEDKPLTNGRTYWECDKIRSGIGCKAKVILDLHFVHQSGEPTHAPDPEKVSVEKIRSGIKRAANETKANTNNFIAKKMFLVRKKMFLQSYRK